MDMEKISNAAFLRTFPELKRLAEEEMCTPTQCVMNIIAREIIRRNPKTRSRGKSNGEIQNHLEDLVLESPPD